MANFRIAISAGHGKNTAGKRCLKSLDPNQTREWVLNSRIAEKVEDLLLGYTGWDLLRLDDRTGEKDIALSTRSKSANAWGADIYLALHHNAAGVKTATWKGGGIVAFVKKSPTAESIAWQKDLYDALIAETGLNGNRASPLAKANFHECRKPEMSAVLLELGFMDSAIDVPIILTEKYADQCARAIVKVIVKRGKLAKKTSSTSKTDKVSSTAKAEVEVDYAKSKDDSMKGTYKVTASDGLNLRTGASTDKQIIEAMPKGCEVECYGYYTGEWLLVVSEAGNKGFCHSGYLKKI